MTKRNSKSQIKRNINSKKKIKRRINIKTKKEKKDKKMNHNKMKRV